MGVPRQKGSKRTQLPNGTEKGRKCTNDDEATSSGGNLQGRAFAVWGIPAFIASVCEFGKGDHSLEDPSDRRKEGGGMSWASNCISTVTEDNGAFFPVKEWGFYAEV